MSNSVLVAAKQELELAIERAKQELELAIERAKQEFDSKIKRAEQEFASNIERFIERLKPDIARKIAAAEQAEAKLDRLLTESWMRERERLTSSAARCGGTRLL